MGGVGTSLQSPAPGCVGRDISPARPLMIARDRRSLGRALPREPATTSPPESRRISQEVLHTAQPSHLKDEQGPPSGCRHRVGSRHLRRHSCTGMANDSFSRRSDTPLRHMRAASLAAVNPFLVTRR